MRPAPEMRPGGTLKGARNLARGLACPLPTGSAEAGILPRTRTLLTPGTARLIRSVSVSPRRERAQDSESGGTLRVSCPVTAECAHESATRRIRASVPSATQTSDLARSLTRRGGAACRLLLLCVRELRRELSARSSSSRRSPRLQPARSRLPLASVHFEQQLDRTLVLPPMALL